MKHELFYPLDYWYVIQPFGVNPEYYQKNFGIKAHNGLDCACKDGQVVRAAHNGIVTFAGEDGSGGWGVVIRTEDVREDINGTPYYWKSIYWHLVPNIPVRAGQKVMVGDVVGYADNTGKSTGTHLHFGCKPVIKGEEEWQWDNALDTNGYRGAVNPADYLNGRYAYEASAQLQLIAKLKALVSLLASMIKYK